jgi:hypothetical protein
MHCYLVLCTSSLARTVLPCSQYHDSRRQRTTRRAVLRPPPLRLPAHRLQKLVRRWPLRRCGLKEKRLQRLVRRWLLRRCGLKEKRSPPLACAAAQSRPPLSPWAGCAAAGRRVACPYYPVRRCLQDLSAICVLSKNPHPKWEKLHLLKEISMRNLDPKTAAAPGVLPSKV